MNTPTLKTQRLILRKFNDNDLKALYEILSDKEVNQFLPWFPLKNLDEAKIFYQERYVSIYQKEQGYAYAICLKENNLPIGYVNVEIPDANELGYGLKKEYWHQGIVSEAAEAVIKQAKKDGICYITATHDIKNIHSGNVMKKIGMHYCYSYKEVVMPKNIPVIFRMYQINLDGKKRIYQKYWDQYEHFIEEDI